MMIVALLALILVAILFPGLLRFAFLLAFLGLVYLIAHSQPPAEPPSPPAIERR